jgi:peptidoglycan DL-endopeptidase CwlO
MIAVGAWSAALAAPVAPADPTTIAGASAALHDASRKAEAAAEAYNLAASKQVSANNAVSGAQKAAAAADAAYAKRRRDMTQLVHARYEGTSLGAAGALIDSSSARNLLTRMGTLDVMSTRFGQTVAGLSQTRQTADAAHAAAVTAVTTARTVREQAKAALNAANAQQAHFRQILSTLSAAQLAQYRSGTIPPAVAKATIAANPEPLTAEQRTIVNFVEAQVGKPYVFAASGPAAYDCSGLSMVAYQLVGIHLSHYAPTQYTASSNHPDSSQLEPGDLVFLYPDIGHVEIYVGNGIAVSAADEELGIRYVNVFADMGSWYGATRLL